MNRAGLLVVVVALLVAVASEWVPAQAQGQASDDGNTTIFANDR